MQRISAQTVRNYRKESHLCARHPHQCLDLTALRGRNQLQWANVHFDGNWHMERCTIYRLISVSTVMADGRLRSWHCVDERFAVIITVSIVLHGGVMVWAGISYGQRTKLHFVDGNLNAQRYRDQILRPVVVPFIRRLHLMLQHDDAQPHVYYRFLELKMSQFFHGLHTHKTCHPLSMF